MMCSWCLASWPRHVCSRGIWPFDGFQRACGANPCDLLRIWILTPFLFNVIHPVKQLVYSDCYPIFQSNLSCSRSLPASKPLFLRCWGFWELCLPPEQPGTARQWWAVQFAAGGVRVGAGGGEPHPSGPTHHLQHTWCLRGYQATW